MHYYSFNPAEYLAHTPHLDEFEDLAYRRMLDYCYLHEVPLPVEPEQVAKKIRMRSHCEAVASVLQEFFELTDDGWINARAMVEIEAYQAKSAKAKASADARWAKHRKKIKDSKSGSSSDANALDSESDGNAKQETLNNKQEEKSGQKKLRFSDDDMTLAKFIFDRIKKLDEKAKEPKFEKWADEIRLTVEIDKRTHKEIQDVFIWANEDSFWKTNILSPKKLREKLSDLTIKMKESKKEKPLTLPADDNKLWSFAKMHGLSDPGTLKYFEYRQKLKAEIEEKKLMQKP